MRIPTLLAYAFGTGAAITLLAGCSGGSSQVAPFGGNGNAVGQSVVRQSDAAPRAPFLSLLLSSPGQRAAPSRSKGWMKHVDVLQRLTYLSDLASGNNDVVIFDRTAKPAGVITTGINGPVGMFVDSTRNLWVANEFGGNITEYARGGTSPINTLNDPNERPVDVTICPNGTIYAANIQNGSSNGNGSISAYANGSTSPTGSLSWPGQGYDFFLTCDANNNVFTTLFESQGSGGSGIVVEYPGGNQSGATMLPITLSYPGGIKTDNAGNLLVGDLGALTVTEYTEVGSPTGNSISTGQEQWISFAVTRDSKVVLGAAPTERHGTALLFPSGTLRQTYPLPVGAPYGAAFDPGQKGS